MENRIECRLIAFIIKHIYCNVFFAANSFTIWCRVSCTIDLGQLSLNRVLSYVALKYVNKYTKVQIRLEWKGRVSYRNFSTVIDYFALEESD